jgi:imidazolonepropionase-like amidohydrolase
MKSAQGTTVIHNGQLVDGSGAPAVPKANVVIQDGRITYAGPASGAPPVSPPAQRIDAQGGTILPGLIEPHWHPSYLNASTLPELDTGYPAEYMTLRTAANARLLLDCGYTGARTGGSIHDIDVSLKRALEEDYLTGPRLSPSGRDICGRGGMMDWNPDYLKLGMEGATYLVDGPVEARAAARRVIKTGAEWIKTYPSGDAGCAHATSHTMNMTESEMQAVAEEAHNYKIKVFGHCRGAESIKAALRQKYDSIEHGNFMDQEGLDMILEQNTPLVPCLYHCQMVVEHGKDFGFPQKDIDGHKDHVECGVEAARKVHKGGGRVATGGGDFGLGWNPHGGYAKELSFFVKYVGFSSVESICGATRIGAELLEWENDLGTLAAGKLADLLVVDGDVVGNITVLEDRSNFIAVMQGGIIRSGRLAASRN